MLERALHMWPVKVLSIAAAVLLYFFTNLLNLENRIVTLPIQYLLPQGYTQATEYPTKARIRLRGNAEKIFGIAEDDLTLSADFRKYNREGQFKVPLSVKRSGGAAAVEPLDIIIDPGAVTINLERAVSREVPVNVRFTGTPRPGFQLISYELKPSRITIVGPASHMVDMRSVDSEEVDLTVRSQDFTQKVRTVRMDNLVRVVGSDSLDLKVSIGETVNKRIFSGIGLAIIGLSPDLAIAQALPSGTVTIQAESGQLQAMTADQVRVLVDASQIRDPGVYQLKTICDAPPRSLVLSIDPPTVNVTVVQIPNDKTKP